MKLAIYSITYAGIWYNGRALSVEEIIERAARFGYEGVEIDGKRPHGFPLDWSPERRKAVRALAERKGVEIVAVSANNNFTSPIPEEREAQMLMVVELIKLARDLGAKIVRIFAAWPGVTIGEDGRAAYDIARCEWYRPPSTYLQRWRWCRDCIKEVARIAEKEKIILCLQNHKPLIRNYRDMIDMVREVGSDYVKCCLDAPLLDNQEDSYVINAVKETGNLQVLSHFGGEFVKTPDGKITQKVSADLKWVNYEAFLRALKDIGYEGFLSYELCHPFLPEGHEYGTLDQVDEQVMMANQYMRELLQKIESKEVMPGTGEKNRATLAKTVS